MKYASAEIKRVFVLRFDDKDDLLKELKGFAEEKKIRSGVVLFLGALKNSKIVAGPKKPVFPLDPLFLKLDDVNEIVGIGTIFSENKSPKPHVHLNFGRGKRAYTGCLRSKSEVFLVVEAVLFELRSSAARVYDKKTDLTLLDID